MAHTSFLTEPEVQALGLGSCGSSVLISRFASIHQPERMHVGDHVRIDDFAVLTAGGSGYLEIGNYVHIASFAALFGGGGITLESYVGVSARSTVYSTNDDYSGAHLTNPTVPTEYTDVTIAPVTLRKHALIGAQCVILPGVDIGEGVAVGALSLVDGSLEAWGIYAGVPARYLKARSRALLSLEEKHRAAAGDSDDAAGD
jgi:dTDP-4-amino-4,6-dideoxy-D-glucose acyltransferase